MLLPEKISLLLIKIDVEINVESFIMFN